MRESQPNAADRLKGLLTRLRARGPGRGVKSFSQCGEDVFIQNEGYLPEAGTYVDVGAGHPVYGSNTFGLYLRGWRGVTVEPNPDHARKHRAVRPRDKLMQVGIAMTNSALTYHSFTNPDYNTFDETARDRAISHGGEVLDTHTIPVRRLDRMLTDAGLNQSIDLMSVDCEGLDLDVLRSNDWLKFRPRLLLVEDLEAIDSPWQESDINKYLDGIGYRRWTLVGYTSVFLLKGE